MCGNPFEVSPVSVVRVIACLEPGGAQLSALRLTIALGARGIEHRLFAGEVTDAGLTRAFGVEIERYDGGLQWEPSAEFAAWLEPNLRGADLVHAHMFGGW